MLRSATVIACFAALCARMPAASPPLLVVPLPPAVANENRVATGQLRGGVLSLSLDVRRARWFPESDSGLSEEMLDFAEPGRAAQIPGPLIRVKSGTIIALRLTNPAGAAPLVVHGLHTRPGSIADSIVVPPGRTVRLRFPAGAPGTYFYWGSTTGSSLEERRGIDSQLWQVVASHGTAVVHCGRPGPVALAQSHPCFPPDAPARVLLHRG